MTFNSNNNPQTTTNRSTPPVQVLANAEVRRTHITGRYNRQLQALQEKKLGIEAQAEEKRYQREMMQLSQGNAIGASLVMQIIKTVGLCIVLFIMYCIEYFVARSIFETLPLGAMTIQLLSLTLLVFYMVSTMFLLPTIKKMLIGESYQTRDYVMSGIIGGILIVIGYINMLSHPEYGLVGWIIVLLQVAMVIGVGIVYIKWMPNKDEIKITFLNFQVNKLVKKKSAIVNKIGEAEEQYATDMLELEIAVQNAEASVEAINRVQRRYERPEISRSGSTNGVHREAMQSTTNREDIESASARRNSSRRGIGFSMVGFLLAIGMTSCTTQEVQKTERHAEVYMYDSSSGDEGIDIITADEVLNKLGIDTLQRTFRRNKADVILASLSDDMGFEKHSIQLDLGTNPANQIGLTKRAIRKWVQDFDTARDELFISTEPYGHSRIIENLGHLICDLQTQYNSIVIELHSDLIQNSEDLRLTHLSPNQIEKKKTEVEAYIDMHTQCQLDGIQIELHCPQGRSEKYKGRFREIRKIFTKVLEDKGAQVSVHHRSL